MAKKVFDKEYMANVEIRLHEVMFDRPGAKDWTQFSLSVRDAMQAAATIYGSTTDEQRDKLAKLLQELVLVHSVPNLKDWKISYKKRKNGM